jgi:hypothetical protein
VTTDTIFSGEAQPNQGGETTPAKTADTGLLTALVGEKQKYKNVEELAKGYANADEHIKRLEEENRKLREATIAAKTLDDVLERMQTSSQKEAQTTPTASVNPEAIQQLVEQTLTGREVAKTRETNLLTADKLMKEKFGEKAAEVFKSKAATPELQRVFVEMAAIDPQQFVGMFAGAAPAGSTVATSSVATGAITPNSNRVNVEWSKEWVTKTRKENPSLYWSSDFQSKLASTVTQNPSLYFGN